ncbi:hypothetical protein CRUP_000155 [Coryphaenoides rupestris]|nr:hypothetical protein CRUP_000155 [Coryphaenoides rupestris]
MGHTVSSWRGRQQDTAGHEGRRAVKARRGGRRRNPITDLRVFTTGGDAPGSFNTNLRPPKTFFKVIFWLGYFNSCLNPIIYPCYSREFKQGSNTSSFLNGSQQTLSSLHPSPRCVASRLAPSPWTTSRGSGALTLSPSPSPSPSPSASFLPGSLQVQHGSLPSSSARPVSPLAREGRAGAGPAEAGPAEAGAGAAGVAAAAGERTEFEEAPRRGSSGGGVKVPLVPGLQSEPTPPIPSYPATGFGERMRASLNVGT